MINGAFPDESTGTSRNTRQFAWYWATVSDNKDPDKRGRVKANIPGVTVVSTDWAIPVGLPGSGSANMGSYYIPRVGSMVMIGFALGDIDEPVYLAGPPIANEDGSTAAPTKVSEKTVDDAPNVRVIAQTENFEVYICDTDSEQRLVMKGLADNTETLSINLLDGSIRLTASHFLVMEAPRIAIRASAQLTLNDRPVSHIGTRI